jgi:hypothetical protein
MSIYDKFQVIGIVNVVIIATYIARLVTRHDNCHLQIYIESNYVGSSFLTSTVEGLVHIF